MFVDVALTYEEVDHIDLAQYGAVAVIDVLRATTTILAALQNGAERVVPVATPEDAFAWRSRSVDVVLGGERGAVRIDGFDLGNSPLEYTATVVAGKTVVLTTTNGTQAFRRVQPAALDAGQSTAEAGQAPVVYAACLRNAAAVAAALEEEGRRTGRGVLLVCSGTDGRFSMEDAYGAAVILAHVERLTRVRRGDGAEVAARIGAAVPDPYQELARSFHGRRLLNMGLLADVRFCAETDVSADVPRLISGILVLEGTRGKYGEQGTGNRYPTEGHSCVSD